MTQPPKNSSAPSGDARRVPRSRGSGELRKSAPSARGGARQNDRLPPNATPLRSPRPGAGDDQLVRWFVNPYTFVPLPVSVIRTKPAGHHALTHLSGWFDWTLSLRSPVLLPAEAQPTTGVISYPGSSLRGLLRSTHEVLAGGCLRVLDADFVPIHRQPVSDYAPRGDQLAVVTKVDPVTGRVLKVKKSKRTVWVESKALLRLIGADNLRSGSRLRLDLRKKDRLNRLIDLGSTNPDRNGSWVVHVADGGAKTKMASHYYYAVGEAYSGTETDIDVDVWTSFQELCSGSGDHDERDGSTGQKKPRPTHGSGPNTAEWPGLEVTYTPAAPEGQTAIAYPAGQRRRVDGWLAVGDTVWITLKGNLKMAAIWRGKGGTHAVKDRIPPSLLPCTGQSSDHPPAEPPGALCQSCALFGSVNAEPGGSDGEQWSYGSHVRVGPATTERAVATRSLKLPPLRSPKPSAGGMYLIHEDLSHADAAASHEKSHRAGAHWGSHLDAPLPRRIRGRKYYWHGQVESTGWARRQDRRQEPSKGDQGNLKTDDIGIALPAVDDQGAVTLTARVYFDNVTRQQLEMLLAAANPGAVLASPDEASNRFGLHLGRGKPLGFGTVVPAISGLVAQTAAERYGAGQPSAQSEDEMLRRARTKGLDQRLKPSWDGLRKVLRLEAVRADRIWYPPVGSFGEPWSKEFDESFKWFARHSGGWEGTLLPLPHVMSESQYLPTEPKKKD